MEKQDLLRSLFQILAFAIFLLQIQNSIKKYLSCPVVQERSLTTIQNIELPSVYICQDNQFNRTKSYANGYKGLIDFTIGKLRDTDQYTWKTKFGNLTFEELRQIVYDVNYTNFKSEYSASKELYIAPHGLCIKLMEKKSMQYIKTDRRTMLLLVDPHKESSLRILEMDHGRIYTGPTYTSYNYFDGAAYEIEYILHDSRQTPSRIGCMSATFLLHKTSF